VNHKEFHIFAVVVVLLVIGIVGISGDGLTGYQVYGGMQQGGTTLDNALDFLRAFGFFNVVLPFLLIFTIVFGVLEKTRIFGSEKFKGDDVPRRNLNSVVAFCIAFFVVAASNVVVMLQVSLPIIALLLVAIVVFLLLFGALMGEEELKGGISLWKYKGFKSTFVIAITVAILAILLAGFGLLGPLLGYVGGNVSGTFITSTILLIIVIAAIWFVTSSRGEKMEGAN
jgi:hypothetical protein